MDEEIVNMENYFSFVCDRKVHSGTLKIAPHERKRIQPRNFADKKKNM